jgi:hypothetical protein
VGCLEGKCGSEEGFMRELMDGKGEGRREDVDFRVEGRECRCGCGE